MRKSRRQLQNYSCVRPARLLVKPWSKSNSNPFIIQQIHTVFSRSSETAESSMHISWRLLRSSDSESDAGAGGREHVGQSLATDTWQPIENHTALSTQQSVNCQLQQNVKWSLTPIKVANCSPDRKVATAEVRSINKQKHVWMSDSAKQWYNYYNYHYDYHYYYYR